MKYVLSCTVMWLIFLSLELGVLRPVNQCGYIRAMYKIEYQCKNALTKLRETRKGQREDRRGGGGIKTRYVHGNGKCLRISQTGINACEKYAFH